MSPIDRSAALNRWRHRPLAEKSLLGLGMLMLVVVLPALPAAPVVAVIMTIAALAGARVPVKVWLACALSPLGFILAGVVSLLVQVDGAGVGLAPGGVEAAAALAARALAALTCLLFLALTTPATDVVAGLGRIGLPAELTEVALLTYRFVILLADTAALMHAAQGARLGHATARARLRSLGLLGANLLPRAMDRARRLEQGLAARGWTGSLKVLRPSRPLSGMTLAAILALEGAVAGLGVFAS